MGARASIYKQRLEAIGQALQAQGIEVSDPRRGGISHSAVVRYLIDQEFEATMRDPAQSSTENIEPGA